MLHATGGRDPKAWLSALNAMLGAEAAEGAEGECGRRRLVVRRVNMDDVV